MIPLVGDDLSRTNHQMPENLWRLAEFSLVVPEVDMSRQVCNVSVVSTSFVLLVHNLNDNAARIHPNGVHHAGSMHSDEDVAAAHHLSLLLNRHRRIEA